MQSWFWQYFEVGEGLIAFIMLCWKLMIGSKRCGGMYHHQIKEVADIRKSSQFVTASCLLFYSSIHTTGTFTGSTGTGCTSTTVIEEKSYHCRQDPGCRLCKEGSETILHIAARYKVQAGGMECHNQVDVIPYRNICMEFGPKDKWLACYKKTWRVPGMMQILSNFCF